MIAWIAFLIALGGACFYLSGHQPFPEISRRFSYFVLISGAFLMISEQGPRDTSPEVPAIIALVLGAYGTIRGSWDMSRTSKDFIVGPFGGCLLTVGSISLMVGYWDDGGTQEHLSSFILASVLILMEIYLIFKGLIIGVPGIAWSKAGLRQIQRGLLEGPSGALAYFENSWDAEEDWLGAMSYAAITKIYRHLGQDDLADQNEDKLNELGGWDAVDSAWNEAVDSALQSLKNSSWSKPTDDM